MVILTVIILVYLLIILYVSIYIKEKRDKKKQTFNEIQKKYNGFNWN